MLEILDSNLGSGLVTAAIVGIVGLLLKDKAQALFSKSESPRIDAWPSAARVKRGDDPLWGVVIENSSKEMIYELEVCISMKDGKVFRKNLLVHQLPHGKFFAQSHRWGPKPWEAPLQESLFEELSPISQSPRWRLLGMSFRDNRENWWFRDNHGIRKMKGRDQAQRELSKVAGHTGEEERAA